MLSDIRRFDMCCRLRLRDCGRGSSGAGSCVRGDEGQQVRGGLRRERIPVPRQGPVQLRHRQPRVVPGLEGPLPGAARRAVQVHRWGCAPPREPQLSYSAFLLAWRCFLHVLECNWTCLMRSSHSHGDHGGAAAGCHCACWLSPSGIALAVCCGLSVLRHRRIHGRAGVGGGMAVQGHGHCLLPG